jgi:hypothetical protein
MTALWGRKPSPCRIFQSSGGCWFPATIWPSTVALDRVGLGDIARHRRRDIKCLIVTGAYERRAAPRHRGQGAAHRFGARALKRPGLLDMFAGSEEELYREVYRRIRLLTLPLRPAYHALSRQTRHPGGPPIFLTG